jgi:hypothetical protein
VKASVAKIALHSLTGAYENSHYRGPYCHNSGPAADRAYQHYLTSIAKAVDAFRKQRKVFVILAATERLDARAAKPISEQAECRYSPPITTTCTNWLAFCDAAT